MEDQRWCDCLGFLDNGGERSSFAVNEVADLPTCTLDDSGDFLLRCKDEVAPLSDRVPVSDPDTHLARQSALFDVSASVGHIGRQVTDGRVSRGGQDNAVVAAKMLEPPEQPSGSALIPEKSKVVTEQDERVNRREPSIDLRDRSAERLLHAALLCQSDCPG